jgi:tetratricopeptide (TPR) repeat protein
MLLIYLKIAPPGLRFLLLKINKLTKRFSAFTAPSSLQITKIIFGMKLINVIRVFILFSIISSFQASAQSATDLYQQAKQYDTAGDYDNALKYYTKTLEADPKFVNAYFKRGVILANRKKYKLALSDFQAFDKMEPGDYEAEYLMAACRYYLGEKAVALELVNKSLKTKPDFFDALKLRGTLYMDQRNYPKAIADLEHAVAINKKAMDVYFILGSCFEKSGNSDSALYYYYLSEKMGYNSDELFNNTGNILSHRLDYNKALIYFGKAIAANPNKAIYYYNEGIAYYSLGFDQAAITSWKKAKELGFTAFDEEIRKMLE